jgi:20S proteasome alpha/beta subunit
MSRLPLETDAQDKQYVRGTPVTLCIAAACQYRNSQMIVTCTDWKSSSSFGATETADKLRWLKSPNWIALTAGGAADADGLVRSYRAGLKDKTITDSNAPELFSAVAVSRLDWLRNNYVQRTLGVDYKHLREKGKKEFPESVWLDTYLHAKQINLGASLIVAGFVPFRSSAKPLICKVDRSGEVAVSDHFEMIGEGRYVALPPILQRQYSSSVTLMDAVYRLYEAKTLAEIVPSVGEDTSIDVLFPNGQMCQIKSRQGYDMLDRMVRKHGPKKRIQVPRYRAKYFESLSFDSLS